MRKNDDFAVIVGINHYKKFRELKGPENDGGSFKEWLLKDTGGGVPEANITEIYSRNFNNSPDNGPFVSHIDGAFSELFDKHDQGKIGRRLYVYFAGHGFGPSNNESALFTADATERILGNHIAGRLYADALETSGCFDELVLFMDCCRDIMQSAIVRQHPFTLAKRNNETKHFLGFATRWGSASREAVFPGGQSRGLFTKCMLDALNGGPMLGSELAAYVYNGLPTLAKSFSNQYQEPEFLFDSAKEIKFSEDAAEQEYLTRITFSPKTYGRAFILRNDTLQPIGNPHNATAVPWELTLPAGLFQVCCGDGVSGKLFQVTAGGQNVDIS